MDGVYLDWPPVEPHAASEPPPRRPSAKHVFAITTPYRNLRDGENWQPRVWVMNDAGATVATYDL